VNGNLDSGRLSKWRGARRGWTRCALVVCLCAALQVTGCGKRRSVPQQSLKKVPQQRARAELFKPIELPSPTQRLGTAVAVLIDTSGSMGKKVRDNAGQQRAKNEIASAALARIVEVTEHWHRQHPDSALFLGVTGFSGVCTTALPMGPFDANRAQAAVKEIARPGGGTAIGLAIEEGFKSLYSTGCIRKHLVCITDGQNTVATPPDLMARQLYAQTKGDVEIHFVAFDTSADYFAFLKDVNGSTVEAADGAQLQARLVELYEKRILVEAMPVERE
jgi:Mg-chelatase subunit ChlD